MKDFYEHIEAYLEGQLSEEDQRDMESALEKDPALRTAVDNHESAMLILDHAIDDELRGFIDETMMSETEEESQKTVEKQSVKAKGSNSSRKYWIMLAAGIVGFLVTFFAIRLSNNSVNNQEKMQFADMYVEPVWPAQRGSSDFISTTISLYREGNKEQAISLLRAKKTRGTDYWIAEIYLAEQQPDSVLYYLPGLAPDDDKLYRDRVIYVSILATYLKGDKRIIDEMIKILPTDMDPYYEEKVRALEM